MALKNVSAAAVPISHDRRATAKIKLEQHLAAHARRARRRKTLTVAGLSCAVVVSLTAIVLSIVAAHQDDKHNATAGAARSRPAAGSGPLAGVPALPPFQPSDDAGADCEYPPAPEPPGRPVDPPRSGKVSTDPARLAVSMLTDRGRIGLLLANDESPCAVNSFINLIRQQFFDGTHCHRPTTSPTLGVLQCGDPNGDGTGGPGYQFANEYPTDKYQPDDPKAHQPVVYPRGTVAMANTGEGTNGSQFLLIYNDSRLPPEYTVFGKIDAVGVATLGSIAKAGVASGGQDGPPVASVIIKSMRLG